LNLPSWSAGPIPKEAGPISGRLLLAYYDPDERLVYAGRAGTGIKQAELERLWRRLQPLAISQMPLDLPAARQPLWIATRVEPRSLGAARARRRSKVSHLDRRQSAAPGGL
jgi:ATP-dependent DNA ligase